MQRWVTYSPSRLGNNLAYATVFGYAFISGLQQKTTVIEGGQPILLTGQQAAWHTQQFSAAILFLVSTIIIPFLACGVKAFCKKKAEPTSTAKDGFSPALLIV